MIAEGIVNIIGNLGVEDRMSVFISVLLTAFRVNDFEIFGAMLEKRIQLATNEELKRDMTNMLVLIREVMTLRPHTRKTEEVAHKMKRWQREGGGYGQ